MRESRLSFVASISEIIASMAVVATVIYAVSELKQSQAMANTDIETVLYGRMLELDRLVIESQGMAEILIRAKENPSSLSPEDRARYIAYEHIFYDSWEAAVQAWRNGLMSDGTFEGWNSWFTAEAARRPAFGWTENHRNYNQWFISYVGERVSWK